MKLRTIPRSRLRVAVVSAFPPGTNSLNEFGWHLVSDLAAKDEVDGVILLADRTDAGPPIVLDKVNAVECWRFNDITNLWSIVRAVRASHPDAVLFNLQFATFGDRRVAGGLGLLAPAVTKAMGVPTGVILHNLVENVDLRDAGFAGSKPVAAAMAFAGRMLTRALLRADYVALTIPRYVEMIRANYGATNVLLAPHGAFESPVEPSFEPASSRREVLAFGKWGTYKKLDTLVAALRLLRGRPGYDDVRIIVAGSDSPNAPGYLAGVQAGCADLQGIEFVGYVAEEDLADLFGRCMVTVFPYTSTTGSSGVLHQAGSYGRAAILPAIGDFAEVIEEEGFVGEYFTPGDPTSLANAIATMVDDPELCRLQGKQNFAAATGIPLAEVVDWHLLHLQALVAARLR